MTSPRSGPLTGIRVLDLTRVFMGPLATQVLADQGADVIMVEAARGDTNRVMGPGTHPELSGVALNLLRNKRSISIDLHTDSGRTLVHRLAATCDVVVATMRPEALTRLSVDYASISAFKPDIVYCHAQGYSYDGPRANDPAYDDIIQAACGITDITERVWGRQSLLPTIIADKVCGLIIAQAVTAALLHRERTGEGQRVEVAMEQAMSAFMLAEHGAGAICEPPVAFDGMPPAGYSRVLSAERRPHRTRDGWIHLFPYLPKHYAGLFAEAGVDHTDGDARYADERATLRNSDSLYRDVRAIAPRKSTAEWLAYCRRTGIPATELKTLQDLVDGLSVDVHPTAGRYRVIPPMASFSATPTSMRRHAPLIGEHNAQIAAELDEI